jgi:hypothetical protein
MTRVEGGSVAVRNPSLVRVAALGAALTCAFLILTAAAPHPSARPGTDHGDSVHSAADLDGDGVLEDIRLGRGPGGVVIADGNVTYTSRPKWHVAGAAVGDTDGNGLPEVVTLLDGPDGRHLGLFAWFAGRYGERLVSAPLSPAPVRLRLLPAPGSGEVAAQLVELTERLPDIRFGEPARLVTTVYRWNGFGYTNEEGAR